MPQKRIAEQSLTAFAYFNQAKNCSEH